MAKLIVRPTPDEMVALISTPGLVCDFAFGPSGAWLEEDPAAPSAAWLRLRELRGEPLENVAGAGI